MPDLTVEHHHPCRLGEAVVWSPFEQAIYWSDIFGKKLFRKDNHGTKHWDLSQGLTSLGFGQSGELIGTLEDGLYRLNLASGEHQRIASPTLNYADIRFNDGAVDTRGHYWAGTMHKQDPFTHSVGSLFRFSSSGQHSTEDYGFHVPNGPCFSADGRWMYHTDTLVRQTVFVCELDAAGQLLSRRKFVQIKQENVYPDGMCLDAEGNLWVALWGGWGVNQYSPDGRLLRHIKLPVAQVTKCVFGTQKLDTLFITSASEYLQPEDKVAQPLAGALFSVKTDTQGHLENLFVSQPSA